MNIKTRIVAALALASLVVPGMTFAQSTSSTASLNAEIQSLLAMVQQLESQITALKGTASINTSTISKLPRVCPVWGCNGPEPIIGSLPVTSSTNFSVTKNSAFSSGSVIAGFTGQRIGSYIFSAPSSEGINVNTITLGAGASASAFQNLKLMVNGTQFGVTQGVLTNAGTYAFSASPISIPAGGSVVVSVYADALPNIVADTHNATAVLSCIGTGQVSYAAYQCPAAGVQGQTMTFAGAAALTIAADSSNPPAGNIVQNSTGNTLAVFRLTETSNIENVKVTQLKVLDAVASSGVKAAFSDVGLWNGSTLLGVASAPVLDAAGTGYIYSFNVLTNPLIVPQGNSLSLTLKGDAGSYSNGSLTDGSISTFEIATTTDAGNTTPAAIVVARGVNSNAAATVTLLNAKGNPQTTLRTVLSVSGVPQTSLPPASFQQLGSITFTANTAGDAVLNYLKLTTNQSANPAFLNSLALKDPSGNDIVVVDGFAKSSVSGGDVAWTFSPSVKPLDVIAGSSYTLAVWGDLSKIPVVANQAETVSVSLNAPTDFFYYDGVGNSPVLVHLSSSSAPITIVNLQELGTANPIPTVTFSVKPSTITANQTTTFAWSSTNATVCKLTGSHAYTNNGAWGQGSLSTSSTLMVTPYALATTSYTAQYQLTCTGVGGTSNPASVLVTVNPPAVPFPTLSIANITGVQSSYQAGQLISFTLDGLQLPSNIPADASDGFNVQASLTNNGGLTNINGVNGSYNSATGLWNVVLSTPTTTGMYSLSIALYCADANEPCYTQYLPLSQVSKNFNVAIVALSVAPAPISPKPCTAPSLCPQPIIPIKATTTLPSASASDNSDQTAIISQSLQSDLNELSALLKSL